MDIPQTPLMLRLISTVFDETGELPKERVTLFSKYADEVLRPEAVNAATSATSMPATSARSRIAK
jgi:hypothetical protein